MSYIALVPEKPLFPREHLTLCRIKPRPVSITLEEQKRAEALIRLIYARIDAARESEEDLGLYMTVDSQPYELFEPGVVVARGEVCRDIVDFHKIAKATRLENRPYPTWKPHITGQQSKEGNFWRRGGERIIFTKAEIRP